MGADSEAESIDDAWGTSPEPPAPQNDRTTHGFYVEPKPQTSGDHDQTTIGSGADRIACAVAEPVVASGTGGDLVVPAAASVANHDQTTIGTGEDRIVPASIEETISELDRSAVSTESPAESKPFALLSGNGVTIPKETEHKLVQPERSPLDFVMTDGHNAVPARARSNDSSRFVLALVGDAPAPVVESEVPMIPTMQPVLRRGRLIRKWSAIGAAVVVVAVVAIKFALPTRAAKVQPPEAAKTALPAAPAPAPAPAPAIAPEPPKPSPVPEPVVEPAVAKAAPEPVPDPAPAPEETAPPVSVKSASAAPAKPKPPKQSAKPKQKSTAMAPSTAKKPAIAKKAKTTKKPTTTSTSAKQVTTTNSKWSPKKRSF